jgi:hypothetical protein
MIESCGMLEQKFNQLMESLKPLVLAEVTAETEHFIDQGEFGIAFEDLCVFCKTLGLKYQMPSSGR